MFLNGAVAEFLEQTKHFRVENLAGIDGNRAVVARAQRQTPDIQEVSIMLLA